MDGLEQPREAAARTFHSPNYKTRDSGFAISPGAFGLEAAYTGARCPRAAIVTARPVPNRKAYAARLVVCLVWGTTYLAIAIAIETIPPLLMAGLRYIVAGAVLVAVKTRGERMPSPAAWAGSHVLGLLLLGLGNGGLVWAEQTIPSGFAALLVATTPFWMVGVDALMPDAERLNRRQVAGLIVGFVGIAMLVWPEMRPEHGGRGFLAEWWPPQSRVVGWALGSTYARRRGHDENVLVAASFEMLFGGLVSSRADCSTQEWRHVVVTRATFGAWSIYGLRLGIVGFSAYAYALSTCRCRPFRCTCT